MSRAPYFEHDDRLEKYNSKPMGRRKYNPRSLGQRTIRDILSISASRARHEDLDGDVDMGAPGGSGNWHEGRRFNPYKQHHQNKRRRDKNRRGKPFIKNSSLNNEQDGLWFKITIPYGKKLGKAFILKSIAAECKVPFLPFNFQFDNNAAVFYVNDNNSALSIKGVNRKLTTPDGFKMIVLMSRSPPPVSTMDAEVSEKIKACMSKHYNISTHYLDLSKFHYDEELRQHGLYVPLHKPIVFRAVMEIIKDHIPELEQLDLSENKLYTLEPLSSLNNVCKNMTSLRVENNRLRSIAELNNVKGMSIVDLVLNGNPLCDDFKDQTTYISAVRERLPKVMRLDGQVLPAPIEFDLGTETLPPSKGSFFPAEDVKKLVIQFLEQYYTLYDSEDREKLLDAYHDQAVFSLTIGKPFQRTMNNSYEFMIENRNILRISDHGHRQKLLKQGRLGVVSALAQLPLTQHDPNSFTVDISYVSPTLMSFTVCGVFKEVGSDIRSAPLRTFNRTFVVVAQGSGFSIVNEMLFMTNATVDQIKAFKFPAPTPSPSPAPSDDNKSPDEKQQLVIEFAKQTGMTLDFSAQCLEENKWDFQKSAYVFNELNSMGRIPQEAFQK